MSVQPTNPNFSRRCFASGRLAAGWLAVVLVGATCGVAQAQPGMVDVQYQKKADMLHPLASNMLPDGVANGAATFRIGVLGDDPFVGLNPQGRQVNHLDEMVRSKATCKGKPISVHRFASAKDYQPCHVLFISKLSAATSVERTPEARLAAVLAIPHPGPVMLAADSNGLSAQGVAINFFVAKDPNGILKVKFEVNTTAAKRDGLSLSPQLLRLASRVNQAR